MINNRNYYTDERLLYALMIEKRKLYLRNLMGNIARYLVEVTDSVTRVIHTKKKKKKKSGSKFFVDYSRTHLLS